MRHILIAYHFFGVLNHKTLRQCTDFDISPRLLHDRSIFLLLDQELRKDAHNTDFTQKVYLTLTFDSKIWFKVTKHPLTTSAVWMEQLGLRGNRNALQTNEIRLTALQTGNTFTIEHLQSGALIKLQKIPYNYRLLMLAAFQNLFMMYLVQGNRSYSLMIYLAISS